MDLKRVASQSAGFSGADVENCCKEAALHAMTERVFGTFAYDPTRNLDKEEFITAVTMQDFQHVMQSFQPSLTPNAIQK